jgi:tRNA-splicing ligase RtcB
MKKPVQIFGQHDAGTINQIHNCVDHGGERAVLCADGHKGYAQPIGGVVAYKDKISISGVGFDIACGNLAILTDATGHSVRPKIKSIMDDIVRDIAFGMGQSARVKVDHDLFDDPAWSIPGLKVLKALAQSQLGTVGGGNHYVDLFVDLEDRVWIGVHFGSRGFGHKTATAFLKAAGGRDGMDVPPTVVDDKSELGIDYLEGMRLAGRYAYAGREAVAEHVLYKILGARMLDSVHNHHNYAWKETSFLPSEWMSGIEDYWEDTGSCARGLLRPLPASVDSLVARWATTRSS